jgi:hypothetical protein
MLHPAPLSVTPQAAQPPGVGVARRVLKGGMVNFNRCVYVCGAGRVPCGAVR